MAELQISEGKRKAKPPRVDHPHWQKFVYLKRFNIFPQAGGLNDQAASFIAFATLALNAESAVQMTKRRKPKKPRRK